MGGSPDVPGPVAAKRWDHSADTIHIPFAPKLSEGTIMRTTVTATAAATAAVAALLLGAGTASAQPSNSVVGMSESAARAILDAEGVPYTVLNRSGTSSTACTVTEQRDRGYRTETDMVYDHDDHEFDRIETQVWRGVGLVVVCN